MRNHFGSDENGQHKRPDLVHHFVELLSFQFHFPLFCSIHSFASSFFHFFIISSRRVLSISFLFAWENCEVFDDVQLLAKSLLICFFLVSFSIREMRSNRNPIRISSSKLNEIIEDTKVIASPRERKWKTNKAEENDFSFFSTVDFDRFNCAFIRCVLRVFCRASTKENLLNFLNRKVHFELSCWLSIENRNSIPSEIEIIDVIIVCQRIAWIKQDRSKHEILSPHKKLRKKNVKHVPYEFHMLKRMDHLDEQIWMTKRKGKTHWMSSNLMRNQFGRNFSHFSHFSLLHTLISCIQNLTLNHIHVLLTVFLFLRIFLFIFLIFFIFCSNFYLRHLRNRFMKILFLLSICITRDFPFSKVEKLNFNCVVCILPMWKFHTNTVPLPRSLLLKNFLLIWCRSLIEYRSSKL